MGLIQLSRIDYPGWLPRATVFLPSRHFFFPLSALQSACEFPMHDCVHKHMCLCVLACLQVNYLEDGCRLKLSGKMQTPMHLHTEDAESGYSHLFFFSFSFFFQTMNTTQSKETCSHLLTITCMRPSLPPHPMQPLVLPITSLSLLRESDSGTGIGFEVGTAWFR